MIIKCKVYVCEVKFIWWMKVGFYKFYMVCEVMVILMVWFCLVLFYGVILLGNGIFDISFVDFLKNLIVIILNFVSLVVMLLYVVMFFIMIL